MKGTTTDRSNLTPPSFGGGQGEASRETSGPMRYAYQTTKHYAYGILKEFSKMNKKNPTEAESIMWDLLRRNSWGVKFRRQHIIDMFIADFICLPHKLIIEIDGGYHNLLNQSISDNERSERLNALGFYVLRFTNEQIFFDTNYVLERIEQHIKDTQFLRKFSPSPIPKGESSG